MSHFAVSRVSGLDLIEFLSAFVNDSSVSYETHRALFTAFVDYELDSISTILSSHYGLSSKAYQGVARAWMRFFCQWRDSDKRIYATPDHSPWQDQYLLRKFVTYMQSQLKKG